MLPYSTPEHFAQHNLAGQLHRLSRLLSALSEHRWASDGYPDVRSAHVQVFRHLDPDGTRSTVLARRVQVTKQTMGRLVKELADSAYVNIVTDPADSRAALVRLTGRGKLFLAYLATTLPDLERAFSQVLGSARLAEFSAATQELLAFAEKRREAL